MTRDYSRESLVDGDPAGPGKEVHSVTRLIALLCERKFPLAGPGDVQ